MASAKRNSLPLACSEPPAGYARWTVRLLAEQIFEREIVESAHFDTVACH